MEYKAMEIFECKPKNLPEDIAPDFDKGLPFSVSGTFDGLDKEKKVIEHTYAWRHIKNGFCSWGGRHPRFWRFLTEKETREYKRFISNLKKHGRR